MSYVLIKRMAWVILLKKKIELVMAVLILVSAFILAKEGSILVGSSKAKEKGTCVVIDAGHGGSDPGKIGINDALEKDINLSIAKKLEKLLKEEDIEVVLTRKNEKGLYTADASNKKVEDMRKRCEIITEAMPVFTVSIHQNSYSEEYVSGAQVFYYGQSVEGKKLAEVLQSSLRKGLDTKNDRVAKANESYYLLKKTPTPTVIVECGFLSNSKEAELLTTEEYQQKVAESIRDGILIYLSGEDKDEKSDTTETLQETATESAQ